MFKTFFAIKRKPECELRNCGQFVSRLAFVSQAVLWIINAYVELAVC